MSIVSPSPLNTVTEDPDTAGAPSYEGTLLLNEIVYEITVDYPFAYVSNRTDGLRVVNVSDPTAPKESGYFSTPGWAYGTAVDMPYAYVAGYTDGLLVFDVNAPQSMTDPTGLVGSWDPDGTQTRAIDVDGQYAYLADSLKGFVVVDISDPTDPQQRYVNNFANTEVDVAISGSYAYVITSGEGVQPLDVANPAQPEVLEFFATPGSAYRLDATGSYVYVADRSGGLQIIDFRNKDTAAIVGNFSTADWVMDVAVSGDYAYIATSNFGLYVLDVSSPAYPVKVGEWDTGGATAIEVYGNTVYLNAGILQVIDVTIPGNPMPKGTAPFPGNNTSASGSYVYQAAWTFGLVNVINISDPTNPVRDAQIDTAGTPYDIHVDGAYAYVADWDRGLRIYDLNSYD